MVKRQIINIMKSKISLILFVLFSVIGYGQTSNVSQLRQQGYQVFPSDGFAVKCDYPLNIFHEYLSQVKGSSVAPFVQNAYLGCSDENNPYAIVYNITVFCVKKALGSSYNEAEFLRGNKSQLEAQGITCYEVSVSGAKGYECSTKIQGVPTRMFNVVKNGIAYQVMVETRESKLHSEYQKIKNSFKIL